MATDLDGEGHAYNSDNGVGDDHSYGHALREVQLAAYIACRNQSQDSRLYKDLKHDHNFDQITGRKQSIEPCCDQSCDAQQADIHRREVHLLFYPLIQVSISLFNMCHEREPIARHQLDFDRGSMGGSPCETAFISISCKARSRPAAISATMDCCRGALASARMPTSPRTPE